MTQAPDIDHIKKVCQKRNEVMQALLMVAQSQEVGVTQLFGTDDDSTSLVKYFTALQGFLRQKVQDLENGELERNAHALKEKWLQKLQALKSEILFFQESSGHRLCAMALFKALMHGALNEQKLLQQSSGDLAAECLEAAEKELLR